MTNKLQPISTAWLIVKCARLSPRKPWRAYRSGKSRKTSDDGFDVASLKQIDRLKQFVLWNSVLSHAPLHSSHVLHQSEVATLRVDFLHVTRNQLVHQSATVARECFFICRTGSSPFFLRPLPFLSFFLPSFPFFFPFPSLSPRKRPPTPVYISSFSSLQFPLL